jgi:DNA-binding response OmpR family regulator
MQEGSAALRSWRLAVDSSPEVEGLVRFTDRIVIDRIGAQRITGALSSDGILLCGASDWIEPRIRAVRWAGLSSVPILGMVPNPATSEVVTLLDCGANDVLPLPTEERLILAKISALMRFAAPPQEMHASEIRIDPAACTVELSGHKAQLQSTPFRLLTYLIAHRNEWVTRERIFFDVFRLRHDPGTSLLRVHVHAIRRALGPLAHCLRGDRRQGRGYSFVLRAAADRSDDPELSLFRERRKRSSTF